MLFGPRGLPGIGDALALTAAVVGNPALLPLLWQAMYLPQVMPRVVVESLPFALAACPERMIVEGEDALALPCTALVPCRA